MKGRLEALVEENRLNAEICSPRLFRISISTDAEELSGLVSNKEVIMVHDEIVGQLEELVKSRNPKTVFTKDGLRKAALEHPGKTPLHEYGVWVYYPWSRKLVHMLDEEEFVEVRTNRNQYKITPEEEKILAGKKIGVIGLSVGQSIALTIAMERICGELRIADFDVLELSNLNRIRAGVHSLGIRKTVMVAREIAEIDPFLKVAIYNEGLIEENVNDFFMKNGKLDVCVEVCDGLYAKIFARQKAKEFKIPVVMNSSDRGTTDIERYDLDPSQPLLHGLIDHLDLNRVKEARTNEEKVPYLLPMLGVETSTHRLKASMLEIQESITTWPQLASGVILGGGICADVCRRILLGGLKDSGRYFVDLEELIRDKSDKPYVESPLNLSPSLSDEEMESIISAAAKETWPGETDPGKDIIGKLVDAAGKAPSGANAQTWKWMYSGKKLYLFFDDVFRPDLLDCDRTTMITGLGSAAENVVLRAHELGLEVSVETEKIDSKTKLVSTFRFFKTADEKIRTKLEPHVCDELASAIDKRVSNRNICKSGPIDQGQLDELKRVARTIPGSDLLIIDEKEKIEKLAEITARMDRMRYLSKGGHNDFRGEARWTLESARSTKNGISFLETMDLTPTEFAGFYVSKDWPVVKHLAEWKLGSAFGKIQRKWVLGSAAMGLLTVPEFNTNMFFDGGRALERVWLAANAKGIDTHPPSLSTMIFNTLVYCNENVLPEDMKAEAKKLLKEFENLFGVDPGNGKVLLLRFFTGPPAQYKSLRYPLDQILRFGKG